MCSENKLCCVCSEKKMSDSYPEYLNPFAKDLKPKPKLTIRNSFKELKRNLRQSFRIKKKDEGDVTLRQKTETLQRLPISYPNPSQRTYYEALPRSRFHERVSRSDLRTNNGSTNPFEEEDNDNRRSTMIGRRAKKRAPLPPNKSMSSQHINDEKLEASASGSHWSLTSVETDYSGSVYNTVTRREEHETETNGESMVEKFVDFNKNMDMFKDDTNNNVITKENQESESISNVPDLVVSCPSETDSAKLKNNSNEADDEEKKSVASEDDDTELVIKDITNNMILEDNTNKIHEAEVINDTAPTSDEDSFLYHEKKSLYIAGSRDELNESDAYTGRVSLYITGSCDDLDASNNNEVCHKNVTDENSNADVVPIPKQRKNKLTKNILLGV